MLGVAGGIAAYKAAEVLRGLTESGHDVTVVPTEAALRFVGEPTWAALSGKPVATDVWSATDQVPHVRLGQTADVVVVAPATADLLARATHGLANDLLTNVLLTARCPVVMAPAMHTEMWVHPATQRNVAELRARGIIVLEPASGRLTGSDTGPGRLPDPEAIVHAARDVLRRTPGNDLAGLKILISAGGTQEAWDPVRYIGNRSSGRQGVELARTAISRGAHVTLVAAHMEVQPPAGAAVVRVESADELHQAMHGQSADVVVMAAAVADFKPDIEAAKKIKKEALTGELTLTLSTTVDVLASLVQERTGGKPVIVGFAAETADSQQELLELGRRKLQRKGCDLLVVNEVAAQEVFGSSENKVTILGADGSCLALERTSKAAVADALWDLVAAQLAAAAPIH